MALHPAECTNIVYFWSQIHPEKVLKFQSHTQCIFHPLKCRYNIIDRQFGYPMQRISKVKLICGPLELTSKRFSPSSVVIVHSILDSRIWKISFVSPLDIMNLVYFFRTIINIPMAKNKCFLHLLPTILLLIEIY